MGYCGGSKAKPTYYMLGDHTEAISIDFDPKAISYEDLLGISGARIAVEASTVVNSIGTPYSIAMKARNS